MVFDNFNEDLQTISVLEVITVLNDSNLAYVPGEGPMELFTWLGLP